MKRRQFLQLSASAMGALSVIGCAKKSSYPSLPGSLLSGCDDANGNHFVARVSSRGELVFKTPVEQRAHGSCSIPQSHRAIFFSRRPGNEMVIVDVRTGQTLQTVKTPSDRHFYGHGVFSEKQSLLFTTENDFVQARGVIGIYKVADSIERVGEFSSYGIGPHQLALLSDQLTLVVANGGLQTHPDSERDILNLDTMASNLAFIDTETGARIAHYEPPHRLMSIRHLDVSDSDRVVLGVQHQGERTDQVPLVGVADISNGIDWFSMPESLQLQINQYTASVAVNSEGSLAVVTCPRGNRVTLWDISAGKLIADFDSKDAAGAYRLQSNHSGAASWLSTNGRGDIIAIMYENQQLQQSTLLSHPLKWDNHATVI